MFILSHGLLRFIKHLNQTIIVSYSSLHGRCLSLWGGGGRGCKIFPSSCLPPEREGERESVNYLFSLCQSSGFWPKNVSFRLLRIFEKKNCICKLLADFCKGTFLYSLSLDLGPTSCSCLDIPVSSEFNVCVSLLF